jgi:hypothetical protein
MRTDENEPNIEYLHARGEAASQVESWLGNPRVMEAFRERIRPAADWYNNVHKVQEANKNRVEEEDGQAAMRDPSRRDKSAPAPGPDYEYHDFLGYWKRKVTVCHAVPWIRFEERPVKGELRFEPWNGREEALTAYYIMLAAIHDCDSVAHTPITAGIWPRELLEYVHWHLRGCYGDKTTVVRTALDWVRQDLDARIGRLDGRRVAAESEPDQKATGPRSNLKKTIAACVGVLAAVLTILQILFGWIGAVWRFFTAG